MRYKKAVLQICNTAFVVYSVSVKLLGLVPSPGVGSGVVVAGGTVGSGVTVSAGISGAGVAGTIGVTVAFGGVIVGVNVGVGVGVGVRICSVHV